MEKITDNFSVETRKDCVLFKIDKSTYKIPSKIYPLNGRKYKAFVVENTVECENEDIKKIFDACKFEIARCYSNSEMIRQGVEYLGIGANIKYYSGWVFSGDTFPMHHAWIVYNDNCVIDGSILKDFFTLTNKIQDTENIRREYANLLKESHSRNIPNHEKYCFGKVIKPMVYIGCEDNYTHAKELFRKAIDVANSANSIHPSYRHMKKNNIYDYSETQKIIKGLK